MTKIGRLVVAGMAVLIAAPSGLWAWGQNGHRIVGEVAARHLTEPARRQVALILDGDSLAEAATWPDEIRSDPAWDHASPWHYMSIDDGETLATTTRSPEGDVLEALERFEAVLRDPSASKQEKAEALRFYVHFVGDVHQPLHVGRRGDRGGNRIRVEWFGDRRNLHSVWDHGLIEAERLSFTEFARFVDDAHPAEVEAWQADPYEEWVRESFCLRDAVYDYGRDAPETPGDVPKLGYAYAYATSDLVADRLVRAGVRLAARLDSIFAGTGDTEPPAEIPTDPAAWCGR